MIDGASARVTPMSRAKLPPPMCAAEIRFPAPAIELAWARTTRETVARGEGVFALLADGRFAFARATRGAEWEETAEALAEDDDEVGADVCIHAEAIEGTCARHLEDVSSHVACVGENLAMACVANARDASARLCLATFEEKSTSKSTSKATSSWTCAVVHEVALPRVACRVVPVEGGAPGRAFVILRPRGRRRRRRPGGDTLRRGARGPRDARRDDDRRARDVGRSRARDDVRRRARVRVRRALDGGGDGDAKTTASSRWSVWTRAGRFDAARESSPRTFDRSGCTGARRTARSPRDRTRPTFPSTSPSARTRAEARERRRGWCTSPNRTNFESRRRAISEAWTSEAEPGEGTPR